jgi:hypothetical protein
VKSSVLSDTDTLISVRIPQKIQNPNELTLPIPSQVKVASEQNTRFKDKTPVDTSLFLDPEREVYIYSGQRFQSSDLQKQYMRSKMWPLQKTTMWTYSPIYNSCAFEFQDVQTGRPGNVAMREDIPVEGKVGGNLE